MYSGYIIMKHSWRSVYDLYLMAYKTEKTKLCKDVKYHVSTYF